MMPSVQFDISPNTQALMRRCSDRAGLLQALARELTRQTQSILGHLVNTRLTGKGPFDPAEHRLGEVSHKLRESARATPAVIESNTITSSLGSQLRYAEVHEFGGTFTIKQKPGSVRLRTDARGNLLRQGKNGKLAVFAKKSHKRVKKVTYDGSTYEVTYPARATFLHAILDRQADTAAALEAAAVNFLQGQ